MKRINSFYCAVMLSGFFCLFLIWSDKASAAEANPCDTDIARICKDAGPEAVMDCLEQHESELSDACRNYEQQMGGKKVEMKEEVSRRKIFTDACKEDMAKFCSDMKPGQDRIEKCLGTHEAELSAPCREPPASVRPTNTPSSWIPICASARSAPRCQCPP